MKNASTETPMAVEELLQELDKYTRKYPRKAMESAIAQRDAVVPELLQELERAAMDPVKYAARGSDHILLIFAFFLLAQFREKRAYPLMAKICAAPGETPFDLIGDTVTESLGRIVASVYDGDPGPLQRLIENPSANEYVRSAACDAFLVLDNVGQVSREWLEGYCRDLFHGRLIREPSWIWKGLADIVVYLKFPELWGELRKVYSEGLLEMGPEDLEWMEKELKSPGPRRERHPGQSTLIDDAIGETACWAAFDQRETRRTPPPKTAHGDMEALARAFSHEPPALAQPTVSQPMAKTPKIGRNDPCPCNSGLKYKKCCGG